MERAEKKDAERQLLRYYRSATDEWKQYILDKARNAYLTTLAMRQKRQKKTAAA